MGSFTAKGLELDKSDLRNLWGDIPEGMVPIGDHGIYVSPHVKEDRPVSPFNCEEWPNSPYCGGVPWTKTPIGADLEFQVNECGGSVTTTPIIGFTEMPPFSVGWIAPHCRKEYDAKRKIPTSLPPPPDIGDIPKNEIVGGFSENDIVCCIIQYETVEKGTTLKQILSETGSILGYEKVNYENHYFTQLIEVEHPTERVAYGGLNTFPLSFYAKCKFFGVGSYGDESGTAIEDFELAVRVLQPDKRIAPQGYLESPPPSSEEYHLKFNYTGYEAAGSLIYYPAFAFVGRFGDIFPTKELAVNSGSYVVDENISSSRWARASLLYIALLSGEAKNKPTNPDDYKKRDCCMQCCTGGQAQERRRDQDNSEILALLREIKKNLGPFPVRVNIFDANENDVGAQPKLMSLSNVSQAIFRIISEIEKALKCIGIDHLPILTPSSIIDDESNGILGDLGDLKNQIFKQRIESLAELAIWDIKNKYDIFGKWQETITIEDSDPTKKGNQPKKIVLPNMARTFRELMLLNSIQVKTLGMLFDVSLKMYVDLANTKISAAVSEAILRDIQDYLDYPTEIKKLDVPLGISIPSDNTPNDDREDLERFLRNSTAKAKFDDWTGEGSMTEMLVTLLRAAESIIGQNYEKLQ